MGWPRSGRGPRGYRDLETQPRDERSVDIAPLRSAGAMPLVVALRAEDRLGGCAVGRLTLLYDRAAQLGLRTGQRRAAGGERSACARIAAAARAERRDDLIALKLHAGHHGACTGDAERAARERLAALGQHRA